MSEQTSTDVQRADIPQQEPLKYLFIAEFADDSYIEQKQVPYDISVIDPEKRNAYYDVERYQESNDPGHKLIKFILTDGLDQYSVDLTTGYYNINGIDFRPYQTALDKEDPTDFRLIYFRQVTRHFNTDLKQLSMNVVYQLGWKAKRRIIHKNRNGKKTIKIVPIERIIEFT